MRVVRGGAWVFSMKLNFMVPDLNQVAPSKKMIIDLFREMMNVEMNIMEVLKCGSNVQKYMMEPMNIGHTRI